MRRQRLLLTLSAVLSVTLWAYACGDGATEPTPPPPDPPRPTTVTVSPATAELTALGATVQLSAEVRDQNGQVITGATVTWASSAAAVTTVSASGLVTAVANGNATITATAGSASGSAAVSVNQEISTVAVAPAEATIEALGDTVRLSAEAVDANGNAVAGTEFSWATGDAAVATVDASGLVTAVANGTAMITATSGSASGSATVTVSQEVTAVTVTPATASLAALGDTVRLTAEAFDAHGRGVAGAEFSWESSDAAVATVDGGGLVTAVAAGSTTITATSGSASASATVTIAQEVSTVAVTPTEASLAALGDTLRLTAEAFDANGRAVGGVEFSWASSDAAVATVDASGLVTAVGIGSATITATTGSVSGTAIVSVAQEVSAVAIEPDTATVVDGDTLRLAATATDANGQVVTGVAFAWASGDTAVAEVDSTGLATGVGAGQAEVTATAGGVTGRTTLTVLARVPTTVAVTPDTVVLTMLGQTAQLSAEVRDQSGRVMDGVPVVWSSADTTVAMVDSTGLVRAVARGAATITATAGEASGDALVTVTQLVDSVTVEPPADTIVPGDTLQLVAQAYDESGQLVAGVSFTWSSSNAAVATVDPSGLVRGAGDGTATITAAAGDARATSEITVINPDRAALVALYEATDGPNWVDNTNWLTDAPLGEWYGVGTNVAGRVVRIALHGRWDNATRDYVSRGLRGELPAELGKLTELTQLALSNNDLTGPIPPELGNLSNLEEVDLQVNALWGEIPPELGKLSNLKRLEFRVNALSGPLPPELGNLANLESLSLAGNALSGEIPPELGNLANLRSLGLHSNALTGAIPPELGGLANLESLYLGSNDLSGPLPPELGNLASLKWLYLVGNSLSGPLPPELGGLANLEQLYLGSNDFTGPIPQGFLQLESLSRFNISGNGGLCVPGTSAFVAWLENIEQRDTSVTLCNEADRKVLESLFERAGGSGWTNADGWVSGPALEVWHGVRADSLGNVVSLDLSRNGLAGKLSSNLGELAKMTELRIGDNVDLSGRLPLSLAGLSLQALHYSGTGLCAPDDPHFRDWLRTVRSHEGTGAECPPLSDREVLEIFYGLTGGSEWLRSDNWLTDAPMRDWYGVEVDSEGRVSGLDLTRNNLSGTLPAELGSLTNLRTLVLRINVLTGPIPLQLGSLAKLRILDLSTNSLEGAISPDLGSLAELQVLFLGENRLEGPIPTELGDLDNLGTLWLSDSNLSGAIPPELGNLHNLRRLYLGRNDLSGPIPRTLGSLGSLQELSLAGNRLNGLVPRELGRLTNLKFLYLGHNQLTGPVPGALGALANLETLTLTANAAMSGVLPTSLTSLGSLETLEATGTQLCAPSDPRFLEWLNRLTNPRVVLCEGRPASAYLVQAVQSRDFPVPLVAGEEALLRVFVTAGRDNNESLPPVRASFHLNGAPVHVADIPAGGGSIPTEFNESSLSKSANAVIAGRVIQPGLEMVIEVDPDGTLDPELGVSKRIPETGRLAVAVEAMPLFDLTLIPFIWTQTRDSSMVDLAEAMAADPERHEMLGDTRTLLPIGAIAVTAHEPVLSSSNIAGTLLSETDAIRVMEGATGHYMGLKQAGGLAAIGGRSSVASPSPWVIAHELGHNLNLQHAPCGSAPGPDPSYPSPDGSIGAWGYDFRDGGRVVKPSNPDLMSYCVPNWWISDYHFTNALRYRLSDEGSAAIAAVSASTQSLLLWGGVGADRVPYLEPAFVIDAPAALPDSAGDYRITGRTADGGEIFSLSFTMPEIADGDGSSSFAFALPVRAGWEDALATITLAGPGGTVTLDGESDIPMAILRDPRTGQVRGFLRDPPLAAGVAADAVGTATPSLEVLFSRGIPGTADWRR